MSSTGRRHASVEASLFIVVLACVLPAGLAALIALWSAYQTMYATLADQAQLNSQAMARAVDGVISGATTRLEAMATSSTLASGDVAGFEDLARRVQPYQPGSNLVLTDARGQQLVNTAMPRGAPLPAHGNRAFHQIVLASGRPAVSDLFVGGALKQPLIAIEVPVRMGTAIPYTLAMGFLPDRFARVLAEQRPDADWVVSIFDSTGTIVARTHEADRFVGSKAAPGLLAAMERSPHGTVETTTLEGTPVIAVYTRSAVAHWTVAVGIPKALLVGKLQRWIAWLVAVSIAMLVLGAAMARLVATRIAGSIRALLEPAHALGRGEPVHVAPLPITEARIVADALSRASDLLRTRTLERDRAAQDRVTLQAQATAFEHAASHDPLTGLPNRSYFMQALQKRISEHSVRNGAFTVLFVDIDDFKPVNDVHGHSVGDELLCAFAARLRSGFRDRDLVARLAGDEFAVLIDDHTPRALPAKVGEVLKSLSRPYGVRHLTLRVSACVGAASYPADGQDPTSLLDAADAAMYRAKSAGKGAFSMAGGL
jgi:diguanylate cyclase (GGDEF)-like protein